MPRRHRAQNAPQAKPKVNIQMTANCAGYAQEVQDILTAIGNLPSFTVVIDDNTWKRLQVKGHAEQTNEAFTNLKAKHLKCNCSLGEQ